MAFQVITDFIAKTTVRIIAYITDDNGNPVIPNGATIIIKGPMGNALINSASMTNTDLGEYTYLFLTTANSSKGLYSGEIDITNVVNAVTITSTASFNFRLI